MHRKIKAQSEMVSTCLGLQVRMFVYESDLGGNDECSFWETHCCCDASTYLVTGVRCRISVIGKPKTIFVFKEVGEREYSYEVHVLAEWNKTK